MRKVSGLTAILLVCLASAAFASVSNWTFGIAASGPGFVSDRWNVVGVFSQYTNGNDSGIVYAGQPPGKECAPPGSASGNWVAVRQSTNPVGTTDMRGPFSTSVTQTKTWTMNIYYYTVPSGGDPPISLNLQVKEATDKSGNAIANAVVPYTDGTTWYMYTFSASFIPGGSVTFRQTNPGGEGAFTTQNWTLTPHDQAHADVLTLTVTHVVGPEPGSLLVLGSGLAGLVTIRRFRRR